MEYELNVINHLMVEAKLQDDPIKGEKWKIMNDRLRHQLKGEQIYYPQMVFNVLYYNEIFE